MKVENYIGGDPALSGRKRRMNEIWNWIVALDAYDYADAAPLEALLRSEPIPEESRPAVADIVSGRRKPNKKAAAKLRLPAANRMRIAGELSVHLGWIDLLTGPRVRGSVLEDGSIVERRVGWTIEDAADRDGVEVIHSLSNLRGAARDLIEATAGMHGVSVETIENLLRDTRKKIEMFPNV